MDVRNRYLFYTTITLFAYGLFLLGFFPLKVVIPSHAKYENFSIGSEGRVFGYTQRRHDKLVIVLIDALRADFVFEHNSMKFTKDLIKNGKTKNFVLRAHPPTVTLPRIKAITTGSIPGFVDVVLNYDSQALNEDNIISQTWGAGRKIVFYGDDTWIKLFPDHFARSDGTTSFFVTDYTEVDDNVTRHLDRELSVLDWDLMVLHYLGLDHIGHTMGPSSPLVDPKLLEMDRVVERIYNVLNDRSPSSVVLVCGDHGMSDQGSHGGASDREVFVPALLLSPSFSTNLANGHQQTNGRRYTSHRQQLQIDLAPTLSFLLGLPVPSNNLGVVLTEALEGLSDWEQAEALHINSQQLLRLLQSNTQDISKEPSYDLYQRAVGLHETFVDEHVKDKPAISEVLHSYESAMDAMATKISSSLTKYDLYSMTVGIVLLFLMLLNELKVVFTTTETTNMLTSPLLFCVISLFCFFVHVTACTSQLYHSTRLCGTNFIAVALFAAVFFCLQFLIGSLLRGWASGYYHKKRGSTSPLSTLLVAGTVGHSVSLLSSSYVEEEHQVWYFLVMTLDIAVIATVVHQNVHRHLQTKRNKNDNHYSEQTLSRTYDEQKYDFSDQIQAKTSNQSDTLFNEGNIAELKAKRADTCNTQNGCIASPSVQTYCDTKKSIFDLPLRQMLPWEQIFGIGGVMLLGRCLRALNQTGNKWLEIPDVGDWLVRPENKPFLSLLLPMSLLAIFITLSSGVSMEALPLALGLIGCYRYRVATKSVYSLLNMQETEQEVSKGISEAMFVYFVIIVMNLMSILQYVLLGHIFTPVNKKQKQKAKIKMVENAQTSFVILMVLLLRPHNTLFVAMIVIQEKLFWTHFLSITSLPVKSITIICWWMGQAVFFQQGNSNSLSTVDVAAGYVGLQDYTPAIVVTLLYCSSYAGPVFWLMTMAKYILTKAAAEDSADSSSYRPLAVSALQVLTIERLFTLCLYCIVATTQRYHLFVWTVFSPKLLYEGQWTLTYALAAVALYCL